MRGMDSSHPWRSAWLGGTEQALWAALCRPDGPSHRGWLSAWLPGAPVVQQEWAAATPVLQGHGRFCGHLCPWGRAPEVRTVPLPAAARALKAIAATNGDAMYEGEIAGSPRRVLKGAGRCADGERPGQLPARVVAPISRDYRGYTLHEIPPNGQGIAALIALGILEKFDLASLPVDSTASQHLQIEAMKLAFAGVYRYVSERSPWK